MSIVGRKVKKVSLHSPPHFEGLGNLTNTISEDHKKFADLELTIISEEGLIEVKATSQKGQKVEGLLYPANIIAAELKAKA